jgi:hypothetical protein
LARRILHGSHAVVVLTVSSSRPVGGGAVATASVSRLEPLALPLPGSPRDAAEESRAPTIILSLTAAASVVFIVTAVTAVVVVVVAARVGAVRG